MIRFTTTLVQFNGERLTPDKPINRLDSWLPMVVFIDRRDVRALYESDHGWLMVVDSSGREFQVGSEYGDYETVLPLFASWLVGRPTA